VSAAGRRHWLKGMLALSAAPLLAILATKVAADDEPVVKLVARRFRYEPREVPIRAGQATVLEITSLDFMHGFNVPDLNLRADLPPGRVTRVRVKFDQPGDYPFLCDNFCGDNHEEMSAKFVVS
jgi:cytochrome c oxidase subunit 2